MVSGLKKVSGYIYVVVVPLKNFSFDFKESCHIREVKWVANKRCFVLTLRQL